MGKGSTNKRKGSTAERYYAKVFREDLGFSFCKTSRQSNRMLDDAGIDLNFLPFNVQIKAGYAKGLNEFKTLKIIRERLPELFPPYDRVHTNMDVLIHKKDVGRGKKRKDTDELVFIWEGNFYSTILNTVHPQVMHERKGQKRGWTFEEDLENREYMVYEKNGDRLVVMTFKTFKNKIKDIEWQ